MSAFRAGADLVETPYFLKLDGDDRLDPTFVERTRPEMRDPSIGFVYTAARFFGAREGATTRRPLTGAAFFAATTLTAQV